MTLFYRQGIESKIEINEKIKDKHLIEMSNTSEVMIRTSLCCAIE